MKNTKNTTGSIYLSPTKFLYSSFKKKIDRNISETLESGFYILGEKNRKLENKLIEYLSVKNVITTASGTDALTLSLKALGLKKDEEVIMPANVYPSIFGVSLSGVRIRLCDVDASTLNISLRTIEKVVSYKTKAIIVVHLYGNPVDLKPIVNYTNKKGIHLIEDCAQAIGAEYKGKKVGSFGTISVLSFYPTKNLAAFGDGGAVLTNSSKLAKKIQLLRMYGEISRYKSEIIGHNSRFDELQAGILLAQLENLDSMNKRRRAIACIYQKELKKLPLRYLEEVDEGKSVYHLFVILTNKRDKLAKFLREKNIETGVHYPVPIHLTKSFKYLGYKKGDFLASEQASKQVLSLPIHPFLTDEQILYICSSIREFFR